MIEHPHLRESKKGKMGGGLDQTNQVQTIWGVGRVHQSLGHNPQREKGQVGKTNTIPNISIAKAVSHSSLRKDNTAFLVIKKPQPLPLAL